MRVVWYVRRPESLAIVAAGPGLSSRGVPTTLLAVDAQFQLPSENMLRLRLGDRRSGGGAQFLFLPFDFCPLPFDLS